MKAKIKKETQIELILSSDEATWLKDVMQNPINIRFPQDENERDKLMRETFFYALPFKEDL